MSISGIADDGSAASSKPAAHSAKAGKSTKPESRTSEVCSKRKTLAFEAISGSDDLIEKYFQDKGLNKNDIQDEDDVKSLCEFNGSASPNQGCWALYEKGEYVTSVKYFGGNANAKAVYEAIDEYCECYHGYEEGCIAKVPFLEPNQPFFVSQVISGPYNTPANYANFCVFAGVANGDIDAADAMLSSEAKTCGCFWVDAVEEEIDNCPGVELGDFDLQLRYFKRVATFPVCKLIHPTCDDDTETVAEIVVVTKDGSTAIFTDSEEKALGFVDVSTPSDPQGITKLPLDGEPTSVALKDHYALVCIDTSENYLNPSGKLIIVDISDKENPVPVHEIDLGGQPDAITVGPDSNYAVIAIENQRDEDLGDGRPPQMPAGYVVIIDVSNEDPTTWTRNDVDVTGLDGVLFPEDPEPEFVSINDKNIAVVTLQENNAVVLIDVTDGSVIGSFSTGNITLENVDLTEESQILQVETQADRPREADGITWIKGDYFVTANEGDMDGGSRGFTVFDKDGNVIYESNMSAEYLITSFGHYNDKRSGNKGVEFENVVYAKDLDLIFVISERSSVVMVYDVSDPSEAKFHQVLPSCVGPEGGYYVKSTQVFVVACEVDSRDDKIRAGLVIYQYGSSSPSYPTLQSVVPDESTGVPVPWAALSGLSAPADKTNMNTLYTVDDSAFKKSKIFTIDVSEFPYMITKAVNIKDSNGIFAAFPTPTLDFSADELSAMINDDDTVNIDQEGIAAVEDGFWIAHEGRGTYGDESRPVESLNFLFKVDMDGVIEKVVSLPEDVNLLQLRFGFEGVTVEGDYVIVAFQRAWGEEANPRLGLYNIVEESWKFVYYPLDTPMSQNGGWVGLSDITSLGDGEFLVLERDNQGGPDAAIKRIYKISLGDLDDIGDGGTITKELVRDILGDFSTEIGGFALEKVEGMAVLGNEVWVNNDNDATDDSSGETQLINLGQIL